MIRLALVAGVELLGGASTVALAVMLLCRSWAWDGQLRRVVLRSHGYALALASLIAVAAWGLDWLNIIILVGYAVALGVIVCVLDWLFPWGRYPCGVIEQIQSWWYSARHATYIEWRAEEDR